MQTLCHSEWNGIVAELQQQGLMPNCLCFMIAHYAALTKEEHLDRLFAFPQNFDFQVTNKNIPQTRHIQITLAPTFGISVVACYIVDSMYGRINNMYPVSYEELLCPITREKTEFAMELARLPGADNLMEKLWQMLLVQMQSNLHSLEKKL